MLEPMGDKTYRHRLSGKLGTYPNGVARVYSDVLEEVPEGAKPLAYVRISEPAIDVLRARKTAGSDDETTIVSEASDLDPATLPDPDDTSERV
jgi:hypothetical protein